MIIKTPKRQSSYQLVKSKQSALVQDRTKDEDETIELHQHGFPDILSLLGSKDQVELEDRGILLVNEMISKQSLARLTQRLLVLHFDESFKEPIQIILNSPGGYCDAGWAFIDLMGFVKNPIRTIGMGEICSMAASIFIAGDERILSPNCSTMIHQFSDYGEGKYGDLVAKGKLWKMEMNKDIAHLIRCSKYNKAADVKKHILKDHDHWLTPQDMKKHGLCDKISTPTPRGKK